MKIIDFERKGNVVRFYLGEKTKDWGWTNSNYKDYTGKTPEWLQPKDTYYGDDWNDRPYDCNAGRVYDEFIKGCKDVAFNFDDIVLEPCESRYSNRFSKEDMVTRKIPCLIVVTKKIIEKNKLNKIEANLLDYDDAIELFGVKKIYFGDELN